MLLIVHELLFVSEHLWGALLVKQLAGAVSAQKEALLCNLVLEAEDLQLLLSSLLQN